MVTTRAKFAASTAAATLILAYPAEARDILVKLRRQFRGSTTEMVGGVTLASWILANDFFVESSGLWRIRSGNSQATRLQAMIVFIGMVLAAMAIDPANSPMAWGRSYVRDVEEP